jgi:hypothetical protein
MASPERPTDAVFPRRTITEAARLRTAMIVGILEG